MTDREAMKLALDALEIGWSPTYPNEVDAREKGMQAIAALKARLAQETALQALHDENKRLGLYKDAYGQPEQDKLAQDAFDKWWAVALDLSQVNRLTHFKTNGIIDAHKYNITGFVLTNGDGKKCISDMAAVRWFDNKDFFGMMHNEPAYPPQRTEQNFCSRCGKRIPDLITIHTCTPPQD
jgi:hypothetical protein